MAVYKITPTKANLIKSKESLSFMRSGYDLLDKKRVVLIRDSVDLKKRMDEISKGMDVVLEEYYRTLDNAIITLGTQRLHHLAAGVAVDDSIEVQFHSMMGVPVPKLRYQECLSVTYGLHDTNIAFDRAMVALEKFRALMLSLAEVSSAYERIQKEIDKTQKRANALEKVKIPQYEGIVSQIESVLEEKEREEFFRLKLVKKGRARKKNATTA